MALSSIFYDDASDVARVAIVGVIAYTGLVVILRLAGKRTLSKLNAFDLVVTVALGSTLATVLLSSDVALVEGMAALALLAVLQLVVAWTSTRARPVRRAVKSEPTLILVQGRVLHDALRQQRVSVGELCQAVRSSGLGDLALAGAAVLETDGTISVIGRDGIGSGSALTDVDRWSDQRTRSEPE